MKFEYPKNKLWQLQDSRRECALTGTRLISERVGNVPLPNKIDILKTENTNSESHPRVILNENDNFEIP